MATETRNEKLRRLYRERQNLKPPPSVTVPPKPKREPEPKPKPTKGDTDSFLDSFGALTQYLPSVSQVAEAGTRAIAPGVRAAYDLLPDHAQEFVKQGIQATTGIDTGAITEKELTPSTLAAMRESAIQGLADRGYADYKDYNISNPSDILSSPGGFVDAAIDPKKRAGYIVGRTDTFEIDPEGNLILKDKFDFGSGEYDGFGWKRRDKKKFGWWEGLMAGPEDYDRHVSSPSYSKIHSLFDKRGPYPWSGALNTERDIRINLGPAPPDIRKKLKKRDKVETPLGDSTQ